MSLSIKNTFKDLDGTVLKDTDGPVTLKKVVCLALNYQDSPNIGWEEKLKVGRLILKVFNAVDSIELNTEEKTMILMQAGKGTHISPWLIIQLDKMLNE